MGRYKHAARGKEATLFRQLARHRLDTIVGEALTSRCKYQAGDLIPYRGTEVRVVATNSRTGKVQVEIVGEDGKKYYPWLF